MKRGIFFALLFFLLIPSVYSVGLRAPDLNFMLDFVPNSQHVYEYIVVTNAGSTMDYELYCKGDLCPYVTFQPDRLYSIPSGELPSFAAIINFPEYIDNPGIHQLRLGVVESVARGGGAVGVRTGSEAVIDVRVLHEDAVLQASLQTPNVNVHEPVNMVLNLENWGLKQIREAKAKITVYDFLNNSLTVLDAGSTSVMPAKSSQLYAIFDTIGYFPGEYHAVADIQWDGNFTTVENYFRIGELVVDISSYTEELEINKINPFEIVVESGWNDPVDNVWAEITIDGKVVKTPTYTLEPFAVKTIGTYFDTSGMKPGVYDSKIVLYYSGKTFTKLIKVETQEIKSSSASLDVSTLIIILIILLVLVNILVLFYMRKNKPDSKGGINEAG